MKMMVSAESAVKLLHSIPHSTCHSAISTHWRMRDDGTATAASFLWLYCWGMTGMNSEPAKSAARLAFEEMFDLRLGDVAQRIPHDWARQMRYRDDLPDEAVTQLLKGLGNAEMR